MQEPPSERIAAELALQRLNRKVRELERDREVVERELATARSRLRERNAEKAPGLGIGCLVVGIVGFILASLAYVPMVLFQLSARSENIIGLIYVVVLAIVAYNQYAHYAKEKREYERRHSEGLAWAAEQIERLESEQADLTEAIDDRRRKASRLEAYLDA